MRLAIRLSPIACAVVVGACAAASQRAYVAPSFATVRSITEEREGPQQAHEIFIENESTVPITVFSMSLRGCDNVREQCDVRSVRLRVQPNGRVLAMTVDPADPQRGFNYSFGFSWHADSSSAAALAALASHGDAAAGVQLAAIQRADSERRADVGYTELGRDDYRSIASQATALRAQPESLLMEPGQRADLDQVHLLLVDSTGQVLGRTHWVGFGLPSSDAVQFAPPRQLVARHTGRFVIHYTLADQAQAMLTHRIAPLDVPVVVAFPVDPHAPVFLGRALDADSRTPLACARVALEDSAQNVVARDQSAADGAFSLRAPRPGTYRVRVETRGFAPSYGPFETAVADQDKQGEYLVRFTDQLLLPPSLYRSEFQHAQPASVRVEPMLARPARRGRSREASAPIVQGVTIGGSETMPILGIVWRETPMTTWAQFVVDSAGAVDSTSILLPSDVASGARAAIDRVLPRVRFTPARDHDRPVCEMLRMQVNLSPQ